MRLSSALPLTGSYNGAAYFDLVEKRFKDGFTLFGGSGLPGTTYPNMIAAEENTGKLWIRNVADSAWVHIGYLNTPFLGLLSLADGGTLAATKTLELGRDPAAALESAPKQYVDALARLRNRAIGGSFRMDQRNEGASFSVTSTPTYHMDRFYDSAAGANVTGQRVAGPAGLPNAVRYTGAASNTGVTIGHRIEAAHLVDWAGKDVALGVHLKSSTVTQVNWAASYANAADNFSAVTAIASGSFTISSSDALVQAPITLPSAAANGVQITLTTNTGLGAAATLEVAGFSLELGPLVNPTFDLLPPTLEELLCLRYFEKSYARGVKPGTASTFPGVFSSVIGSGGLAFISPRFIAPKRATPTVVTYNPNSGTSGQMYDATGGVNSSVTASTSACTTMGGVFYNSGTAYSSGGVAFMHATADAEL